MNASVVGARPEKIGVLVVHGVGETREGWIDSYFVPELEKWLAYENVGGAGRKDPANSVLFAAETADRRIAIALGDDGDFANFCRVTGLEQLLTETVNSTSPVKAFATRADRAKRRDRLNQRIAGTLRTKSAADWLVALQASNVPCAIAFKAASEVYRVRDPKSSDPLRTWGSFTRRWPLDGREVHVCELYWADLSKVGTTTLTRLSALVQLFLESPYVLGRAFLDGSDKGIHKLISWLILASNWIMRWPLAGLNVAVFFTAFVAMALQQLGRMDLLFETTAASLAVVATGGFLTFRKWQHRKVGLSDLALASSGSAVSLMAVLGLGASVAQPSDLASPEHYLIISMWFILAVWAIWTGLIIAAVLLVILVGVKRLVIRAGPENPPLVRPAAAISLSLLLGMIWKLVLSVLGILVISTLVTGGAPASESCPAGTSLRAFTLSNAPADCQLSFMKALLVDVSGLNVGALIGVALAVLSVVAVRNAGLRLFRERATAGMLWLPRLIANPLIVMTIFAGAFGTGALGLVIFYFMIVSVVEMSDGFVHIGRDLVDHQYDPNPKSLAGRLESKKARVKARENGGYKGFRRRRRIQARLEALMQDLMAANTFDRLVFFGHSQGTVILHDYLFNHGNFVDPRHYQLLAGIDQIDVITIGSPLTHIYRYYFRDYDSTVAPEPGDAPLIGKIKSWTNLWRVDDPIGQNVDYLESISNVGLGPGGHTYYWKENQVCAKLWSVIQNEHPASSATSGAQAAE